MRGRIEFSCLRWMTYYEQMMKIRHDSFLFSPFLSRRWKNRIGTSVINSSVLPKTQGGSGEVRAPNCPADLSPRELRLSYHHSKCRCLAPYPRDPCEFAAKVDGSSMLPASHLKHPSLSSSPCDGFLCLHWTWLDYSQA